MRRTCDRTHVHSSDRRPMKKETVFGVLTWAVIIGLLVLGFKSCNWIEHRQAMRLEEAKKKKNQEIEREFNDFCAVNNASRGFSALPKENALTMDLQRSFVLGKRVAFKARLSDIWLSAKRGTMMAYFPLRHGGTQIGIYLKCFDSQAQELHDAYEKNPNTTFLIVAQFEEVEPNQTESTSESDSDSDSKEAYGAHGRLLFSSIAKYGLTDTASAISEDADE